MKYNDTIDYLFNHLPMYQRVGKAAYKADLSNTYALCELLGNPHHQIRSIHIAGTNGKGSVAHILASILQSAGMKVGLHTSPHFKDFRERIRINGNMIPKSDVIQFVEQNQEGLKRIQPSFFEMAVVMAFDHFAKQKVDVAVVETGMGGRLDSTNVLTPLISIITNIGLDHIQFLGNTLEKIAVEKAGIIKSGVPVVIGEWDKETKQVFLKVAGQRRAPLYFADTNLTVPETDLKGAYQKKNIITSLKAMEVLKKEGMAITADHIVDGLKKVIANTGFMGRWQVLQSSPTVICDAGHNLEGIQLIQQEIKEADYNKLHFVLGFVNDKDIDSLLELLPKEAEYYYCKADIPRGMDAHALARKTEERGLQGNVYPSVLEAFHAAKENARKDDMVFIGGSTFVVAEVL